MKPTKMRNRTIYTGDNRVRSLLLCAPLSKELRQKYSRHSIRVIREDTVRIVRGAHREITGSVVRVHTASGRVDVEGIQTAKAKGDKANIGIHASNVIVTNLHMTKWSRKVLERGGHVFVDAPESPPDDSKAAGVAVSAPEPKPDRETADVFTPESMSLDADDYETADTKPDRTADDRETADVFTPESMSLDADAEPDSTPDGHGAADVLTPESMSLDADAEPDSTPDGHGAADVLTPESMSLDADAEPDSTPDGHGAADVPARESDDGAVSGLDDERKIVKKSSFWSKFRRGPSKTGSDADGKQSQDDARVDGRGADAQDGASGGDSDRNTNKKEDSEGS